MLRLRGEFLVSIFVWKYQLFALVAIIVLLIGHNFACKKGEGQSHFAMFFSIVASLLLSFYCCRFILEAYKSADSFDDAYLLWSILIILSFIISFCGAIFLRRNAIISTLCFINVVLLPIIPIGTDVGWLYYVYYIPVALFIALSACWQANNPILVYSKVCLIGFILLYSSITGYTYQNNYVYRDANYSELVERVNSNVFKGMYTTKSRSALINQVSQALSPYSGCEIISLGGFNLAPLISDTTCFFSTPWPDLDSFSYDKFCDELYKKTNAGVYPVILFVPDSDGDGEMYHSTTKYDKLAKFIEANKYVKCSYSEEFHLYVPRTDYGMP